MANDFDYAALKESTKTIYKTSTHSKLKKLERELAGKPFAGLILTEFKRTKDNDRSTVLLLFKKRTLAINALGSIHKRRLHASKLMRCVEVTYDSTKKIDGCSKGSIIISPIQGKGSLPTNKLLPLIKSFKIDLKLKLQIGEETAETEETNTDENTETPTSDTAPESSSDNNSTLEELKQEFQTAQKIYKSLGTVDAKLKAKTMLVASQKIETFMPKLNSFMSSSDNAEEVEKAKEISAAAEKIQTTLKPHIDNIKAKQGEKSNASLDTLTGGISSKAAQLLNNPEFQDQINGIEGLADKLKSISELA